MTATFGKLRGSTLELQDGLNILQAPNETGKSTWCAFLLAILYGINSRERDRAGFIADKNRFAPWSGVSMSGRMDCSTDLGELTLTRATRRQTSPMGEFAAVYTGTNEPVPGLTGTGCFDMVAYEKFHDGRMSDYIPTDADLQKGFDGIPRFPGNEI